MLTPFVRRRSDQRGVYLLEVLVAILILSVGMIGLLGLMLRSYALGSSANYRNVAVMETARLADALRANVAALSLFANPGAPTTTVACFSVAGCTAQQMANTEVSEFRSRISTGLPNGTSAICQGTFGSGSSTSCSTDVNGAFNIRVCWTTGGSLGGGTECLTTQL